MKINIKVQPCLPKNVFSKQGGIPTLHILIHWKISMPLDSKQFHIEIKSNWFQRALENSFILNYWLFYCEEKIELCNFKDEVRDGCLIEER